MTITLVEILYFNSQYKVKKEQDNRVQEIKIKMTP